MNGIAVLPYMLQVMHDLCMVGDCRLANTPGDMVNTVQGWQPQ